MISESALLWLGTIALLTDYVGLAKANNQLSRMLSFLIALLFWVAFTMNALSYKIVSDAVVYEQGSQSMALIGLIGAIVTLLLLFQYSFKAISEAR